ncbi:virion core protein, T7 gp14 family [Rhizobium sp. Leaf341]|uniref:virion core protein, T7 gp14 family n=1 Tax=Rhizobium sp. Leaf341 TaxID=1736344 RepID=UPI00071390C0|nr:hypothetical protein [Rhizobium sp. Leaf341]KQR67866.1 hypothetical protein ASG03_10120 [Rhizobium sp. Leaf341]
MCDLGLGLGIASGIAGAMGDSQAASKNAGIIKQQANLEYAAQERERLVESDGALKEGYQAQLEADRGVSAVRAKGEGMGGSTAALQVAEQKRQGALSIANAKDRQQAANANYAMAGKNTQIGAQNRIDTQTPNPFTQITNIATSGLQNYGAFK